VLRRHKPDFLSLLKNPVRKLAWCLPNFILGGQNKHQS
jgi:hypothetical protein